MRNLFSLLLCMSLMFPAFAQYYANQNKVWAFGGGAGLDFTSGAPVAFTSSINSNEGVASVCNSAGSLLFYTDGRTVYNRLGIIMPAGTAVVPFPTTSATQGAVILPFFDDPNKYYLFSVEQRETGGGHLAYSVVDMTLDAGLGDIPAGSAGIMMDSGMSEKMIIVPGNSCNAWLVVHKKDLTQFYAFEVTTAGVSTSPVISNTGTLIGVNGYAVGSMKCSHDRQKIATASYGTFGPSAGLELYDFDPSTGIVSNCRVLETTSYYGCEFSPDNTKLYAGSSPVYQWDVSLSATAAILASKTAVSPTSSNATEMRIGPDGRLYIGKGGGLTIDRINFPNNTGAACGFVANAVSLSPAFGRNCFPTLVWDVRTISGASAICAGATSTFTTTVPGGTWSSSNTGVATVGATGVVTGVAPGTAIISYATGTTCDGALTVTVTAAPSLSTTPVCVGNITAITASTGPGTWSSGSTGIATVGATTGIVTGIAAGTALITYNGGGCPATTTVVTVNTISIAGSTAVCEGSTITLGGTPTGGTWSSSSVTTATVSATGIVAGLAAGTSTISYSTGTGCIASSVVTINTTPFVSATGMMCLGGTMTLTSSIPGGTWSSSDITIATVGLTSGIVSGVSFGTVVVTNTSPLGCTATEIVPVYSPMFNVGSLCVGGTLTLIASTPGGLWYSSNTPVATVGVSSGLVTGVAPGTSVISYSLFPGCSHTATVTVTLATPPGSLDLCTGTTGTVSGSVPGGAWTSSNTAVATVGAATGIVTAVSAGTAILSYVNSGQCLEVTNVTISQSPPAITGPTTVCTGGTVTLSNTMAGGTWSSTSSIATIGSTTGVLTGIAPGFVSITYTAPGNSCYVVRTDTVNVCKTGIQASQPGATVAIYPNPATDELYISVGQHSPVSFAIYNALGQVLMSGDVNGVEKKVNVRALPAGEYKMVFDGDGVRTVRRFVKW